MLNCDEILLDTLNLLHYHIFSNTKYMETGKVRKICGFGGLYLFVICLFQCLWWKLGWIMLIPSFVVHIPFYHSSENTIGIVAAVLCTMQCVVLILSVFPTEKALKRAFTEDGMRK